VVRLQRYTGAGVGFGVAGGVGVTGGAGVFGDGVFGGAGNRARRRLALNGLLMDPRLPVLLGKSMRDRNVAGPEKEPM